jgi:hypothetical protein
MQVGTYKALHFGGFENGTPPRSKTIPKIKALADAPETSQELNPLLAMGRLMLDHQLVGEKLRSLHLDPDAYHGNLQVVSTTLSWMRTLITMMIEQCEGK